MSSEERENGPSAGALQRLQSRLPSPALAAEIARVIPGRFGGGPAAIPAAEHPLKRKHLDSWTLVKRARFNAAKRLERKQSAGIVTLAIVALYGGLISVFNLMFKHRVGGDTRDILEYVAVVSSWLTLIIGLTEQQKNHGANARELHDCARDVNDLQKQLAATPIYDEAALQPFLGRYREIMERCRPNHDDIDYQLAEATLSKDEHQRRAASGEWNAARHRRYVRTMRWWHYANTYWFYVAIWTTPPLVGLALWLVVPASSGTPTAGAH